MIDEVVYLVVSMDEGSSILWLCVRVSQKRDDVSEMWNIPNGMFVFDIDNLRLRSGYRAKSLQLSVVETCMLPEAREIHRSGVYSMHLRYGPDGITPHIVSISSCYAWKGRVFENASIQEFHDIERCSDHRDILTETICFWHVHICSLQCMNDLIFSLHLMGGLGHQLPRRLLAKYIFLAVRSCHLVCRVGLAIAELRAMSVRCKSRRRLFRGPTCRRLTGSCISRTWASRYLDNDCTSMGCLTAPAMMPAPTMRVNSHGSTSSKFRG